MARQRSRAQFALARVWAYPLWCSVARVGVLDIVQADVDWWMRCIDDPALLELDRYSQFAFLSGALTEFRNLVHFRLRAAPTLLRIFLQTVYRPLATLVLEADTIGPGFFIQHGQGSIITATSIGSRCWVNQLVTIGHAAKGRPTLGDDVRVGVGAVVLGPITLHDGSTVGANATVVRDVGPGETVVAPMATPLRPSRPSDDG